MVAILDRLYFKAYWQKRELKVYLYAHIVFWLTLGVVLMLTIKNPVLKGIWIFIGLHQLYGSVRLLQKGLYYESKQAKRDEHKSTPPEEFLAHVKAELKQTKRARGRADKNGKK